MKGKNSREEGSEEKKKQKNEAKRTWMSDFYYGRTFSIDFFRKNAWFLVVFLVLVIALMGLRYDTKSKMKEIKVLTEELERAQSSKLQEKAAYMSLIRETEMRKLVEERGLDLEFREDPPYILVMDPR